MIVVTDNQGDWVEVGETRKDLEDFLAEACSDDYAEQVVSWFDSGQRTFQLENGWENVTDTWTNFAIDEDEEVDDEDDEDEDDEEDEDDDFAIGEDDEDDEDEDDGAAALTGASTIAG